MKKAARCSLIACSFLVLISIFSIFMLVSVSASASASSVDSEIFGITSYAEDYEIGNIDYAQLVVYLSGSRQRLGALLGIVDKREGGLLTREQLLSAFGDPTDNTGRAWSEKYMREVRLKEKASAWQKIIFDGRKIQLWLNAWPSVFEKEGEQKIFYRIDMRIVSKAEEESFDIISDISEIGVLAENYAKNPGNNNANELAKKSVAIEKKFQDYLKESGNCESTMDSLLGSQQKKQSQKMFVQEIDFFSNENADAIMRLEMCDSCEWPWVNLNFWIQGPFSEKPSEFDRNSLQNLGVEEIKDGIRQTLDQIKALLEQSDFGGAMALRAKLESYNEAWNRKSDDIWKTVEKNFQFDESKMSESDRNDPYYWVRQDQQKQKQAKSLVKQGYEERKQFYMNLFSGYEKTEYWFDQLEYEKRLYTEYFNDKRELCSNQKDDNQDEQIDCADSQCLGQVCGSSEVDVIGEGNEIRKEKREMYCIAGTCQLKEESTKEAVCGNHVCEGNEANSCKTDCIECPSYGAIGCSGKVIFKGKDKKNCPLEPICIEEDNSCSVSSDCLQPLCGRAECTSGVCKVNSLEECRVADCADGEENILNCDSGEKFVGEKCIEKVWVKTGAECVVSSVDGNGIEIGEERVEGERGDQCNVKEDCGNLNDVCSNGRCIMIPEVAHSESETLNEKVGQEEEVVPESAPAESSSNSLTGQVISFVQDVGAKVTAFVISSFDVSEAPTSPEASSNQGSSDSSSSGSSSESTGSLPDSPLEGSEPLADSAQLSGENQNYDNEVEQRGEEERGENERIDDERREKERTEQCETMCTDNCERTLVVPCVQKCVYESASPDSEQSIEECKRTCGREVDLNECQTSCTENCKAGKDFGMQDQQENEAREKAVFKAGGNCRVSEERKEGGLWFDGWGGPFENLRYLKQQYYSSGSIDWCKRDFEQLTLQRRELEKSLNDEFLKWFFEKYMANSAEDWEEHISGIFELYWKDVELSKEMARARECLNQEGSLSDYNLIKMNYDSEFGKVEFWEEVQTARIQELNNKEMEIISPYMKIWIFPPEDFIKSEMKNAMKEHKFPGPKDEQAERENQEGPTEEEKEGIREDNSLMRLIGEMSEKHGGNTGVVVQFVDDGGNVVFNLYAQVNENDILKMEPMLPEEVPKKDITIQIDWNKVYKLISEMAKSEGQRIESPPWDRTPKPLEKIREIKNGIEGFFKVRSIINSAKIIPESEGKDVRKLINKFFSMIMREEMKGDKEQSNGMDKPEKPNSK